MACSSGLTLKALARAFTNAIEVMSKLKTANRKGVMRGALRAIGDVQGVGWLRSYRGQRT